MVQGRQTQVLLCLPILSLVFTTVVRADDTALESRVLVDFADPLAFTVRPEKATASVVEHQKNGALEITTDSQADHGGVFLEPREKKWDLTSFDRVEMRVINPQDVPVRVLLSVNDPEADSRAHCSVESVTIAPHDQGTLVVPFGVWHGETGQPIDLQNITSVQVLLDRPGRSHHFLVENIRALPRIREPSREILSDPFIAALKPPFGRGINLGNALEAPREGDWGVRLRSEYFAAIRAAGFDSIRLPVNWSAHSDKSAPYQITPQFFSRVDWAIQEALRQQLQIVINVHHFEELMKAPDLQRDHFLVLWQQIADHYRDFPPELAFELLNEPCDQLTGEKWNQLLVEAIAVVRRTNPTREIVVGPVRYNSVKELGALQLPKADRHLIATVHYYEPHHFTHQGAGWAGGDSQKWLGMSWLGTSDEQQSIKRDLEQVFQWSRDHQRPVYLGEFGVIRKADLNSRMRWTRFVADEALKRKIGFAYWDFCAEFAVYDPLRNHWIDGVKDALLPLQLPDQ